MSKNIIITGTSRGIGYELALQFANAGHQVLAISRKTPKELIENPNITCLSIDISNPEELFQVENFINNKFKLILSDAFDEHQKKTYLKIKSDLNVTNDEEVNFLYNNALKIVNDLAIQKNISKRNITKKDFKNKINTKDSLFNIWFVQLKGIATYCKTIHKKYFASSLNTTKKERFFILPNESIENLKKIIYTIEEKFYKSTTRGITSEAPYIFIKGLLKNDLISLKKSIYGESKIINDGIAFFGADFQIKELFKPSTLENKISIKFINEENYLNKQKVADLLVVDATISKNVWTNVT